ncbi:60S ribosomal protein L31 [Tupaia chinensis]|uniref:Large ribosomal subunit protein eL31 n=1 Tax=Tupaia chinensis TaxID=246437 RepID=L9KW43_TUPCH|nr:60S ribosomal protein L31 [Tupaia chinensis]
MAPTKKDGEKGPPAINEVVTWEYTINIHKHIHGLRFKKRALKEIQKLAMKETGIPDVRTETRINKGVWAKEIRNVPYCIYVQLFIKRKEDEDSLNKLYTLVT